MSEAKEVINALMELAGDKVPADLSEKINGLDFVSSDDANARAKAERLRAERKAQSAIEAAQLQIDGLNDKIEQLTANGEGTKADRATKELERLQAKYDQATSQINELQTNLDSTTRNSLISSVASGLKFTDGLSQTVRDYAIKEHFKDYSNDDLKDKSLVGDALKTFMSENAGILVTSKPSGAGTGNGDRVAHGSGNVTRESIKPGQMSREQLDAAWSAASNGTLT